jgi:hypothetical protein
MQLGRIGAEKTQQMPKKQRSGSHRKKQHIRHLRSQPGCIIHRRFPNQPAQNAPNESQILHVCQSLL